MNPALRRTLLFGALAGAAGLAWFGDKTPPGAARVAAAPVAPAARTGRGPGPAPRAAARAPAEPLEEVLPRQALAAAGQATADLFAPARWRLPPPAPPPPPPARAEAAPAPPPVPDYRVIGKKLEGSTWEVFLGRADQSSLIARVGETLDAAWRVERIEPPTMTLTHVPSGRTATLPVGEPL